MRVRTLSGQVRLFSTNRFFWTASFKTEGIKLIEKIRLKGMVHSTSRFFQTVHFKESARKWNRIKRTRFRLKITTISQIWIWETIDYFTLLFYILFLKLYLTGSFLILDHLIIRHWIRSFNYGILVQNSWNNEAFILKLVCLPVTHGILQEWSIKVN